MNESAPGLTPKEGAKALATLGASILLGRTVKRESSRAGLIGPVPAILGLVATVSAFLVGDHFLSDVQLPEAGGQYPPNRRLDI
jgi:hypothetical protein